MKQSTMESDDTLSRLSQSAFPARVRALLEGALDHASAHFEPAMTTLLDAFDGHLFKQAERASNNEEQQEHFESLRALRRSRDDVAPRFLNHLEAGLARLAPSATPAPAAQPGPDRNTTGRPPRVKLELVDSGDLEISLALRELAARAELRHGATLQGLRYRFGVLGASAALDMEAIPFGPAELADALRYAFASCALALPHRVLAYQLADRQLIAQVGEFYAVLNHWLAQQGLLPNLDLRATSLSQESAHAAASRGTGRPANETAAPAQSTAEPTHQQQSTPAQATAQAPAPAASRPPAPAAELNPEQLNQLRALLAAARPPSAPPIANPSTYQASGADLQSVLRSLQMRAAGTADDHQTRATVKLGELKRDVLGQLRQHSPHGLPPTLAQEDSDTIDLVGMLFDYIGQNTSAHNGGHNLLAKLQVPILRTALADKEFFTRPDHPARRLLGSIADATTLWMGEHDADQALVEKVHLLVERATREFSGDLDLIQQLVDDLGAHTTQLARRAEIAERRHVEAAKGRDKLVLARQHANATITRLLARSKPAPMVRAVLEQAWTDVLALTILRHGEESQAYRRRLAVADQLQSLGSGDNTRVDLALREEVHGGLVQVGLHSEAVDGILQKLFSAEPDSNPQPPAELAVALESRARLGVELGAPAPAEADAPKPPPLSTAEQVMLQRIRALPFGTWFDFVINQQGALVRRKLAWFSPVSGRCLFVNARGARADEKTMEQLARDLVHGRVQMVVAPPQTLIERAWKAISTTLQRRADTVPSPA